MPAKGVKLSTNPSSQPYEASVRVEDAAEGTEEAEEEFKGNPSQGRSRRRAERAEKERECVQPETTEAGLMIL